MDVASSPPSHNPGHEPPPPPDPSLPPPPAPHQRRHTRYSSANPSHPPPPPHVVINARRRRSPHPPRARSTMNSSTTPSGTMSSSSGRTPAPSNAHSPPPPTGQDHDRMETDEESERSESEGDSQAEEEHSQPQVSTPNGAGHDAEPVLMDTTPDFPDVVDGAAPPSTNSQASQTHIATIHGGGTDTNGSPDHPAGWEFTTIDGWPAGLPANAQVQLPVSDAMLDSGILRQELDEARRREEPRERDQERERDQDRDRERDRERERERNREDREREEDGDDGSDSDESMDEADNPYWANFTPDTSTPDESEMATIEKSEEIDATNHEHWESLAFEPLDDPEYVPKETGRISWTVTGNHGTPDKPNRKLIMRSPSVYIGGLYWNIKYFPRGNDGTEYMSVYVECSPKPYESLEEELADIEVISEEKIVADEAGAQPDNADAATDSTVPDPQASTAETESSPPNITPQSQEGEPEAPWSAAAQVACVIYNPEEPRVYANQQCSHQYYNGNPDWGWTRFHGPWREIHTRRRGQRKPLLQNDTLVFTAYIRIVEDHTKSLWWHPSDSHPMWDSVSLLGLRGLKCRDSQSSAMVAAVSAWMHLASTVTKIFNVDIPNRISQSGSLLRPALNELQELIGKEGEASSSSEISLSTLASVLGFFYGSEVDYKKDVIIIWENLRRVLNLESNPDPETDGGRDILSEVVMLRQPDPFRNTNLLDAYLIELRGIPWIDADHEPASVQESLDYASMYGAKAFKSWETNKSADKPDVPSVLQIELHRQNYDSESRKWKKLTHKIALNETVVCNKHEFTLYGMIVHRGGLDYSEYYSVLRPEGPGSRWIKYSGEGGSRAVEVLTSKAAVDSHEGGKDDESAAVAYVAMYIRTDRLAEVLSPETKKDVVQRAQKRKSEHISTAEAEADTKPANFNPFRIGRRYWRKAPPVGDGKVYDDLRELSHFSRSFYRTEYNNNAMEVPTPASEDVKVEGTEKAEEKTDDADPASHKIHGWIKIFNHEEQKLSEAKRFPADGSMNIIRHLKEQLGVDGEASWDFYFEQGLTIKPKNLVKNSSTFFDLSYGDTTWDGMLFIGQPRPSAEEIEILEAAGKCVNPIEYSQYLLGDYHPALYSAHLSNHYFTYPYLSVPLSQGRPHGSGVHIALSGSEYRGPFRCGRKAGAQGTMRYAGGDTYVGDWAADEPDGQGTMTYAKTGNVYTGGWRKRRRHGKGDMRFEVADEEMMLCGVCYERDMDAVFCFCGHVVACEECARRVEYCPVCREVVKRVVVLKGPLGGGDNKSGGGVGSWGGGSGGGGGIGVIP